MIRRVSGEVLEICRITLLSNSFSLHTFLIACFRDLQNYTTLKLELLEFLLPFRFRDLQNYTTLVNVNIRMYNFDDVQCTVIPSVAYGFVTGMNLQLC